jgi:hypothetical protein
VVLRGPYENWRSFLEAVDLLKGVFYFFSSNKNFKCCEGVLNQVDSLLTNSAQMIEEEFRQLMDTYRYNLPVLFLLNPVRFGSWVLLIFRALGPLLPLLYQY